MKKWMTWAAGLLALLGTAFGGFTVFDQRYAKAGEVQQQVDEVKQLYLQSERREIQRQRFQIAVESQRRKLTPLEQEREAQLAQEEKAVDSQIHQLNRRK